MQTYRIDYASTRERILGESVRSVAADLRLIDLPDLVTYIKTGQIASVAQLVQASIELWFKAETLTFGQAGDVYLDWDCHPKVSFDMEFHHESVHVFFRLMLEAGEAGVEITYIAFDGQSEGPEHNTGRLNHALSAALLN